MTGRCLVITSQTLGVAELRLDQRLEQIWAAGGETDRKVGSEDP